MNPYYDQNFFGFALTFIKRLFSGQLIHPASDEVQLLILIGVAASSALVGTFLILRKMSMLANSLSHTILLGIVMAFLFSGVDQIATLLIAAVMMGLITAFLTEFLQSTAKLQADASVGIAFTSLFALGVISVTLLTRSAHFGIEAVMGNADALSLSDAPLVYVILLINLVLFGFFFKEYAITTFDPAHATVLGISSLAFNYLLMVQVSITSIGAFRAVGVLMVLAFMTVPPLTARMLTHRLKPLLGVSVAIGCLCSFLGVAISRHFLTAYGMPLSTAGLVVCVLSLCFLSVLAWKKRSSVYSEDLISSTVLSPK